MADTNASGDRRWEEARAWLEQDPDPGTRSELEALLAAGDDEALGELFGARLEFGTAGLRGVLGPGPNAMNRALVRKVTAGLAAYLLEVVPDVAERGVVVGRDGRRMSREFAADTAGVLAGAGIPVHFFPGTAPTPLVAYAVEKFRAAAGVVVTASHNPPQYNGYKVYWANGAQIIPPHDRGISASIDDVGAIDRIPVAAAGDERWERLVREVPAQVGEGYLAEVSALRRHPGGGKDFGIVYTPLHGVGGAWVRRAFERAGYARLAIVPEQAEPDGEFPTVTFPNPEEEGAMDLALALARREGAELVLANDPDADRLAVIVSDGEGGFRPLTGNQIGILLAYYLLTENPPAGAEPLVVTTIVSSSLLRKMAEALGAHYRETLTGFKWIANTAIDLKRDRGYRFFFGFEEALGYTVGELVRDKDGVGAALVFADLAGFCRDRGSSVLEYLEEIYRRFGVYASAQRSVTMPGSEGLAAIRAVMESFRAEPPAALGSWTVAARSDLEEGTRIELATGESSAVELPSSNVLVYELDDGSRVLLRPSGTEPKIKYYFEVVAEVEGGEAFAAAEARADRKRAELIEAFMKVVEART